MKFQTAITACTIAGIFLVETAQAQTAEELATQISQRPAFQHPIIYVGDQAPPRAESQELWFDLTLMRTHGVPTGLAALENLVTNHLDSPWTPSVRSAVPPEPERALVTQRPAS